MSVFYYVLDITDVTDDMKDEMKTFFSTTDESIRLNDIESKCILKSKISDGAFVNETSVNEATVRTTLTDSEWN